MDAVSVIGGINFIIWPKHLFVPVTGFPLAFLYGCVVVNSGYLDSLDTDIQSVSAMCIQLFIMTLAVDGTQYFAHRLAHRLWRRSHNTHHVYRHPTSAVAFHTGVTDAFFQVLMPISLCTWILNPHRHVLIIFGSLYSVWLQFIHSSEYSIEGKRWFWLVTPAFHKVHHVDGTRHFGHVFTIWDHIFSTI